MAGIQRQLLLTYIFRVQCLTKYVQYTYVCSVYIRIRQPSKSQLIMYVTCILMLTNVLDYSFLNCYMYVHTYAHLFSADNERCRIIHVSIVVLTIYTFGTSLAWWWLYKKLAQLCCNNVKDNSQGSYVHTV